MKQNRRQKYLNKTKFKTGNEEKEAYLGFYRITKMELFFKYF